MTSNQDPTGSSSFWTFIPQSISIKGVQASGALQPDVYATGWFAFATVSYVQEKPGSGFEPVLATDVLTESSSPITLRLGINHFNGKAVDQISASDVISALKKIFSAPFNDMPPPPAIPKPNIPPSKRKDKK